ncbi:MAG TPA: ROK family transcriptional regulator [Solirubrobacteraceae bacterium]|nr:ROK family transcriptional regulator [Solirubrobacteraceae bacterium]
MSRARRAGPPLPRPRERSALRVLEYLWRQGPASRVDVVRGTALSRATVSKLVGELCAQGMVTESPALLSSTGRAGRPPSLLALNPAVGAVGGIDFDHHVVWLAVADLSGTVIAERRHELDVDNEAERAIELAVVGLRDLAVEAQLEADRLIGVGAAISAPVRRDSGSLAGDEIMTSWRSISVRRELEERLGVPVHVGNDANLGALAEVRAGAARGAANVLYLMLSYGVGGGLVLDGSLFTGHSGVTGELGHVPVEPDGARCRCGNRGCLETVAGAERLLDELRPVLGAEVSVEHAAALARGGDPLCREKFRRAGIAAGRVAGGICNVINPELVIVGGDLILAGDMLVDAVRKGVEETAMRAIGDVRVVAATLGDRSELLGAIGLAIAEADIAAVARAG